MLRNSITEVRTEFVDREGEMALLESMYEHVKMGSGAVLMITGEAGVGKTRLLTEFGRRVKEDGAAFLIGKCTPQAVSVPYLPITSALERYSNEVMEAQGIMGMGIMGINDTDETWSTSLMGFSREEEEGREVRDLGREKERMFEEVLEQLQEVSHERPTVLFLDDLHLADIGTLQMFAFLAENISNSRIFICTTHRPDELIGLDGKEHPLNNIMATLASEKLYTTMELQRLEKEDVSLMIKNILNKEDVPPSFYNAIYEETEGNPLFVEEVLASLIEEGIIDTKKEIWDEEIDISSFTIPSTIVDVFEKRVSNLSKNAKMVLRYGALIGNEFDFELIRELGNLDEEVVLDALDELMGAGIIREMVDGERIYFLFSRKHTTSIIYDRLSRSRRRIMHRKVGYAMEKVYSSMDEHIYALANHFYQGHVYDKAYNYLTQAAQKSIQMLALDEALQYYLSALDVLVKKGDLTQSREELMHLSLKIGELMMSQGRWEEARPHFERGLGLARDMDAKKQISVFLRRIGDVKRNLGEYDEAEELYDEALDISLDLNDHDGIAEANRGLGYIHWRRGEFRDAIAHYNQSIASAMKINNNHLLAMLFIELGNTYNQRGDLEKALDYYERSMPTLEELGDYQELARALNNSGDIYLRKEDWENAIKQLERCRESAEKARNRNYVAWSLFNAAEAYAKSGRIETAEEYARKGLRICRETKDRIGEHGALKALGITLTRKGEYDEAIRLLEETINIADEMHTPYEKGISLVELSEAYLAKGDREKQRECLEKAREIFKELGAEQDIEKVEEKLKALGSAK